VNDLLASIIADALGQADELLNLDATRAELWASDLIALALEASPEGPSQVAAALAEVGGAGPIAALWALQALTDDGPATTEIGLTTLVGPAPPWATQLGTSVCEAAWLVSNWRGSSAAFRFVDQADDRHAIVVDLVPAGSVQAAETVGEVTVGPPELLDAIDDPDAKLAAVAVPPVALADRVAAALRATTEPAASLVAAGRMLLARLSLLEVTNLVPPVWVEPEVEELPAVDRDEQDWARSVLRQALGATSGDGLDAATAAETLRHAAATEDGLAQWLAASHGPVDLDDDDLTVVLAALAATVQPATAAPLALDARVAVATLEYADWLGMVIGLVRAGPGAVVEPEAMVDLINRCPEVTSTIPKSDRARVAWAIAVCTEPWEALEVTVEDRLTPFGLALLPAMLDYAWTVRPEP